MGFDKICFLIEVFWFVIGLKSWVVELSKFGKMFRIIDGGGILIGGGVLFVMLDEVVGWILFIVF